MITSAKHIGIRVIHGMGEENIYSTLDSLARITALSIVRQL